MQISGSPEVLVEGHLMTSCDFSEHVHGWPDLLVRNWSEIFKAIQTFHIPPFPIKIVV